MLVIDKAFFQGMSDYLSLGKCLYKVDSKLDTVSVSTPITKLITTKEDTNETLKSDSFIKSDYSVGALLDRLEDIFEKYLNYDWSQRSVHIQNTPFVHLIDRLINSMTMPLADPSLVVSLYDYHSKNENSGILFIHTGRDIVERPVVINGWRWILSWKWLRSCLQNSASNLNFNDIWRGDVTSGALQFVRGPFVSGTRKMKLLNPNLLGTGAIFSSYQRLADITNLNCRNFSPLAAWRATRDMLLNGRAEEIRLVVQEAGIPIKVVTPFLAKEVLDIVEDGVTYHSGKLNLIKRLGVRSSSRSNISDFLFKYPVVSLGQLMSTVLRDYVHSTLVQSEEFFCRRELMSLWRRHLSGNGADDGEILWRVVVMIRWLKLKKGLIKLPI